MFKLRSLLPALMLLATVPSVSEAQFATIKPSYKVQVKWEHWRSGGFYWATVFETEDEADAELMYGLLLNAFHDGEICEYIDCGDDWNFIITGVRLIVDRKIPRFVMPDRVYQPHWWLNRATFNKR